MSALKLLLAIALAATTVFFAGTATAVRGADDSEAGGGFCSAASSASASASSAPLARERVLLNGNPGFGDWFAGGVVNAGAEGIAIMGFNYLTEITGAKKHLPKSQNAKVLEGLERIQAELPRISGQLNRVGAKVDQLMRRVDEIQLHNELKAICAMAGRQQGAFRRFKLAIEAGSRFGHALVDRDPKQAAREDPALATLRSQAIQKETEFLNHYDYNGLEGEINEIREALLPGSGQISVLRSYGRVLAGERFLTRADSNALRALYSELANYWALSAWMGAEFWAGKGEKSEWVRVLRTYRNQLKAAEAALPAMIPPGVVVDYGETTGRTLARRPMWFAPSAEDLGWVPPNNLVNPPFGRLAVDEVGEAVAALNARGTLGKGWSAPSQAEVRSLISKECIADPKEPRAHIDGAPCLNALKRNETVAQYLLALNPHDETWRQLFCQPGGEVKCPPDSGPSTGRTIRHAFVWTDEIHSQRIECGSAFGGKRFYERYDTYTGFRTLKDNAVHALFPHLPRESPTHEIMSNATTSRYNCDRYFEELAVGRKDRSGQRGPRNGYVEGVLLATRFSGRQDASENGAFDFMAQPLPGAK